MYKLQQQSFRAISNYSIIKKIIILPQSCLHKSDLGKSKFFALIFLDHVNCSNIKHGNIFLFILAITTINLIQLPTTW